MTDIPFNRFRALHLISLPSVEVHVFARSRLVLTCGGERHVLAELQCTTCSLAHRANCSPLGFVCDSHHRGSLEAEDHSLYLLLSYAIYPAHHLKTVEKLLCLSSVERLLHLSSQLVVRRLTAR